jgi:hypothetical protein
MLHDRQLHPRQLKNHRGELVFDLHAAHVEMLPSQFQGTRTEYQEFDLDIFRQRIYQEERYQKYWNWLEDKRTEKQRAHKEQQEKTKVKEAKKQEKKKAKEEEKKSWREKDKEGSRYETKSRRKQEKGERG